MDSSESPSQSPRDVSSDRTPNMEFKPGRRFYAAFGSLCILVLATYLDATALGAAIPVMSERLNGTAVEAFWAGTSFLLASTVAQLTFGGLSHTFGRKQLILLAVIFFTAGSLVVATAHHFTVILVGRSIQGIGGGAITTLIEILITDLIPLRHRGTWFGYQSGIAAVGTAVGPIAGGGFTDTIGWQWIFWINVPLCVFGFIAIVIFLKLHKVPGTFTAKLLRFDWIGVILLTVSLTSFLVAISWGNIIFPWSSWQSLVPLILGLCGIVLFIVYEAYIPTEPLVQLQIFRQRTAAVNYLGTVIHGTITWCLIYYLPIYYQGVLDMTPTMSGVAVFPETFTVPIASMTVGILVSKLGTFRWAIWGGWAVTVTGFGLLYLLNTETQTWQWVLINIVPGIGLGMLYSSLAYGVLTAAEEQHAAHVAAMYIFSRALGQSIGVTAGGAILQSQLEQRLGKYPEFADRAGSLAKEASALVEYIKSLDHALPERIMLVKAYAESLRVIWAVMSGLAALGLITSALTRSLTVDRPQETAQGFHHETPKSNQPQEEAPFETKTG